MIIRFILKCFFCVILRRKATSADNFTHPSDRMYVLILSMLLGALFYSIMIVGNMCTVGVLVLFVPKGHLPPYFVSHISFFIQAYKFGWFNFNFICFFHAHRRAAAAASIEVIWDGIKISKLFHTFFFMFRW